MATIPDTIERPPYVADGGWPAGRAHLQIIDGDAMSGMRRAGAVAAEVLRCAGAAVAPGVTTGELDDIARDAYVRLGAFPSTLGYKGFRHSVCTSVNEVACHGIPDSRPLREGDIVNVDVTAFVDGFHGDTSATFPVGAVTAALGDLVATSRETMMAGIAAVAPGGSTGDIGRVIEAVAHRRGYGVVTRYGGHGIGRQFHGAPHIHHVDTPRDSVPFVEGMTFTVEPMLTIGTTDLRAWDDGWTEVTADGLPSAQFEHTVTVTGDGVEILTLIA